MSSGKDITVGVVVPVSSNSFDIHRNAGTPPRFVAVTNPIADMAHTKLFVDDEPYHDVVAVEFSTKHLLLCVPVRADHDDAVAKLKAVRRFNIVVDVGANPGETVISQRLDGFRFDRINYRCNTHHFVAAPATDKPSGVWIAELRFVAPLTAVDGDAAEERAS